MKKIKFWGAIGIFIIILMRPNAAVASAQKAMRIWYTSVAPTLFPFLALMPLLTSKEACAAYETMFSKYMRVLFGLPGAAAPAVVVGMIAGSPGGAIALRRIAANSNMKSEEVRRIALATAGVSPAYLIMGIGQGLYGSTTLGLKLAGIQFCIQFLLLKFLPCGQQRTSKVVFELRTEGNKNSVSMAVESLLGICGYMVFFSIVAGVAADFVGQSVGSSLLLIMDLPTGLVNLANMQISGKMALTGAAVGFCGICIAYQNMDIHKDLGIEWKDYLITRCIAALLFACGCLTQDAALVKNYSGMFKNIMTNYAVALLIAGFLAIPCLCALSNKLFLNKRKNRKNPA